MYIIKQIDSLVDRFLLFDQMALTYCAKVGECDIGDHLSLMEYSTLAAGYDKLCAEITILLKGIKIKNGINLASHIETRLTHVSFSGRRALQRLILELSEI